MPLSTIQTRKLPDGRIVQSMGHLTLTTFDLLEQKAELFELKKHKVRPGPRQQLTKQNGGGGEREREKGKGKEKGFKWLVLRHGDEEVGLVWVKARYEEHFLSLVGPAAHPDQCHVRVDEVSFDRNIMKRNIERIDDILSGFKVKQVAGFCQKKKDFLPPRVASVSIAFVSVFVSVASVLFVSICICCICIYCICIYCICIYCICICCICIYCICICIYFLSHQLMKSS